MLLALATGLGGTGTAGVVLFGFATGPGGLVRATTTMSTRRLLLRPSSVSLLAIGRYWEYPAAEIGWVEAVLLNQQRNHFRGARGRKLPIRFELAGMDGHIVGVSFHANMKPLFVEDSGDAGQRILSVHQKRGIAAVKEADLSQAHDQAFRSDAHLDFVLFDLFS